MKEYLVYNRESGFTFVFAENIEEADEKYSYDYNVLDETTELDSVILERIRELIKDD